MKTTRKKMRGGVDPVALKNAIRNTEETLGVLNSMVNAAPASSASVVPEVAPASEPPSEAPASVVTSDAPAHTSDAHASETHSEAPASVVTSDAPAHTSDAHASETHSEAPASVVTSEAPAHTSETPEPPKPARFTVIPQKMGNGYRLNLENDSVFNDLKFAGQMRTIYFNVNKLQTNPNDPIKSLLTSNKLPAEGVAKFLNAYLDSNPETSPTVFTLPIPTGGTKKRKMMRRRMRTKRRNTMKKRNRSH